MEAKLRSERLSPLQQRLGQTTSTPKHIGNEAIQLKWKTQQHRTDLLNKTSYENIKNAETSEVLSELLNTNIVVSQAFKKLP